MAAPRKPRVAKPKTETPDGQRTIEGWRGNAIELTLGPEDLALVDLVLTVNPLLRIVAALGQEARKRELAYPVDDARALQSCLGKERLVFGNHRIDMASIAETMPETWFPIAHEGELLSRIHLALLRCEHEAAQMAPRPVLYPVGS